MYPDELVVPMKHELTDKGFQDLTTAEEVNQAIKKEGTTLLMVNSVCGCAAGASRPGAVFSLTGDKKPDNLITVFAGVDKEAVDAARQHLAPFLQVHHVSRFSRMANWCTCWKDTTLKVIPQAQLLQICKALTLNIAKTKLLVKTINSVLLARNFFVKK
jgi:hypothetical protein